MDSSGPEEIGNKNDQHREIGEESEQDQYEDIDYRKYKLISYEIDSDVEDDIPRPDDFAPEIWERYHKQVEESEGFNVDYYPRMWGFCGFFAHASKSTEDELRIRTTKMVIDIYNQEKGKEDGRLELWKVLDASLQYHPCLPIYITFEAKNIKNGQIRTYQAIKQIMYYEEETQLVMFRLKPGL